MVYKFKLLTKAHINTDNVKFKSNFKTQYNTNDNIICKLLSVT